MGMLMMAAVGQSRRDQNTMDAAVVSTGPLVFVLSLFSAHQLGHGNPGGFGCR